MSDAVKLSDVGVMLGDHYPALSGVTAELAAGQITGFIGPSGAGKTTLIRAIVGRQRLSEGKISVFGQPAGSAALRREVSYMTQSVATYGDLSARDNLHYFAVMAGLGRKEARLAVDKTLHLNDLTEHADQLVSQLSGGQKQRVSLGLALVGKPKLLVLDEPTVGLDPVLRERLWALFHELAADGVSIIVSSHVMEEASRCDDLILIRDGRLLAHGSPDELCHQTKTQSVEAAFLTLVGDKS